MRGMWWKMCSLTVCIVILPCRTEKHKQGRPSNMIPPRDPTDPTDPTNSGAADGASLGRLAAFSRTPLGRGRLGRTGLAAAHKRRRGSQSNWRSLPMSKKCGRMLLLGSESDARSRSGRRMVALATSALSLRLDTPPEPTPSAPRRSGRCSVTRTGPRVRRSAAAPAQQAQSESSG